jgi:phage terminase large subunit-like protein
MIHPLSNLTRAEANYIYSGIMEEDDQAQQLRLCKEDLYFLLTVAMKRRDVDHDWLYARCREVEAEPDGMLDLWAREHYKSTIITFALTIQDILNDPNVTCGIFSHTRPIAKAFLKQIKTELEDNEYLKALFPEILYANPRKDSPAWSLDGGITVRRTSNPKEATVEAHGLVDGQPTSRHFNRLIYDDVVTRESVTNEDQIKKTTEAWELSLNLGAHGGKVRYIGTRYHFNDTWRTVMERGAATPRIHTATHDGTVDGRPVFLTAKQLRDKRTQMGPYTFGSQMLQNPIADAAQGFKREWLKQTSRIEADLTWNRYLLCDPAGEKKKANDYTVMVVLGLAPDGNTYLLDGLRDRLNLTERTAKMFDFVERWSPNAVGYEKYGKDSDIEHIESEMENRNYRFEITPLGGTMPKNDRIRRLVPDFETGRFWLPPRLLFLDHENKMRDFVAEFINDEYEAFPVGLHDDMFDCMSRIKDVGAVFPKRQQVPGIPGLKKRPAVANNKYDVLG